MAVRTEKPPGKDLRVDLTYVEICGDVVRNSFPQKKIAWKFGLKNPCSLPRLELGVI